LITVRGRGGKRRKTRKDLFSAERKANAQGKRPTILVFFPKKEGGPAIPAPPGKERKGGEKRKLSEQAR